MYRKIPRSAGVQVIEDICLHGSVEDMINFISTFTQEEQDSLLGEALSILEEEVAQYLVAATCSKNFSTS